MKAQDTIKTITYLVVGKTTICHLETETGFEVVGTSAPVNKEDFDEKIGEEWAYKNALDKLEENHAYLTQYLQRNLDFQMRWSMGILGEQVTHYTSVEVINDEV